MKVKAFGFDPEASRDMGVLFLPEVSKTLTNGSCPGRHNGVVVNGGGYWTIDGSIRNHKERNNSEDNHGRNNVHDNRK